MFIEPVANEQVLSLSDITFALNHYRSHENPDDSYLYGSHVHDHYEIYVNMSGDISFLVNNTLFSVKRGDAIVTRPGDLHVCFPNHPCVHERFCLWITAASGTRLFEPVVGKEFCSLYRLPSPLRETFTDAFFRMEEAVDAGNTLATANHLYHILHLLTKRQDPSQPLAELLPPELQAVIDHIDTNFLQIHSIQELAEQFGVSPATLTRWFRKYIHIPPQEFLKAKRITYAKKLLDQGATVTESCMGAGFSDCSYFISVFKQKFGETPLRYKQHSREVP